jgi:hypothetical protein
MHLAMHILVSPCHSHAVLGVKPLLRNSWTEYWYELSGPLLKVPMSIVPLAALQVITRTSLDLGQASVPSMMPVAPSRGTEGCQAIVNFHVQLGDGILVASHAPRLVPSFS